MKKCTKILQSVQKQMTNLLRKLQNNNQKEKWSPDTCESEKIVGVDNLSLLEDPEIFILDTGATMNSKGNSKSMTNMKTAQGSITKMGNRAKTNVRQQGL